VQMRARPPRLASATGGPSPARGILRASAALDSRPWACPTGTAALGLVVPTLHVDTGRLEQESIIHGLLDVLLAGELARAAEQAAYNRGPTLSWDRSSDQGGYLLLATNLYEVVGSDHRQFNPSPERVGPCRAPR